MGTSDEWVQDSRKEKDNHQDTSKECDKIWKHQN
jgi:hypothetical protein